jgi:cell division protein FtsL
MLFKLPGWVVARLVFFLSILLWLLQIWVSNRLATNGAELGNLEKRIVELQQSNQKLSQEITEKSSLEYLSVQAEKRGLTVAPKMIEIKK